MKQNYGFEPITITGGLIIGCVFAFLLLVVGGISVVKIWQFAFASPVAGSIPIWVIFLIGMVVIMYLKRK